MKTLLLLAAMAVPLDPIPAVIDVFRTHDAAALADHEMPLRRMALVPPPPGAPVPPIERLKQHCRATAQGQ
jgi:hypothetical protein